VVAPAKLPTNGGPPVLQETVPVYPVPAVVVVTGVAPVTGAVTPAIAATAIVVSAGVGVGVGVGAATTGAGGGGGVAVVMEDELADSGEAPAALLALNVNV